jgi:Restriction Enzyme Adenine Methylase Associated
MNRRIEDMSGEGWTETLIDKRTDTLIEALLATWPVPEGHIGEVSDGPTEPSVAVSLKQLIAAGYLAPGTALKSRPGTWGDHEAIVLDNGDLAMDGKTFNSPSAAGHHLRKFGTNGWYFWRLPDGRRLADLRRDYYRNMINSSGAGSPDP